MSLGVLDAFTEPFFEGSPANIEIPSKWPAAIDGIGYIIEPSDYRRHFTDQYRDPTDTQADVGEASLNTNGAWRRGSNDWRAGAGQTWFDDDDSRRDRFRASEGIDPWTPHQIKRLHATSVLRSGSTVTFSAAVTVADAVYSVVGATVKRHTVLSGAGTTCTGFTGPVTGLAVVGKYVYIAGNGQLGQLDHTAGSTAFTNLGAETNVGQLWAAGERLMEAKGSSSNALYEIDSAGTRTQVKVLPLGYTITGVTAAADGVYFCATNGTDSYVGVVRVDPDTGDFGAATLAAPLPAGEQALAIYAYAGTVLIGTDRGFRLANPDGGGGLTYGPAVNTGSPCRVFAGYGKYVWFGWNRDSVPGIGRIDPSTFSEQLVPAYATDLTTAASGWEGDAVAITFGPPDGTVDRPPLVIATISPDGGTAGVLVEAATYVASGTIYAGRIRLGVLDPKVFTDFDWRGQVGDGTVAVTLTYEDGTAVPLPPVTAPLSIGPSERQKVRHAAVEWMEPVITLTGQASSEYPTVNRWLSRARPVVERVEEIIASIILFEQVKSGDSSDGGLLLEYDVLAAYAHLRNIATSHRVTTFQIGSENLDVTIENLEQQPTEWNRTRGAWQGKLVVQMQVV